MHHQHHQHHHQHHHHAASERQRRGREENVGLSAARPSIRAGNTPLTRRSDAEVGRRALGRSSSLVTYTHSHTRIHAVRTSQPVSLTNAPCSQYPRTITGLYAPLLQYYYSCQPAPTPETTATTTAASAAAVVAAASSARPLHQQISSATQGQLPSATMWSGC